MAIKKKFRVLVSCYFDNGANKTFILDPTKDKLEETPKELKITRGDDTKGVIRVDRSKLCYYVVSRQEVKEQAENAHRAFDAGEDDGYDFR